MKIHYRKYQIKYLVRAIVYVEVIAENFGKAQAKAEKVMNEPIFRDSLETIEERIEFAGYDDMTTWDETEQ